jgi:hypothetical protein
VHGIRRPRPRGRIAAEADHIHPERLRQLRQPSADPAQAHDQHRLALEFVLALGQVADHAAPDASRLVVARLRQPPHQGQDQRHRVFGHRARVDARRTGQPDAAARKRLFVELVGARADRLDEAQLCRQRDQPVVPHAGHHDHVGLVRAPLEVVPLARFEALYAGVQRVEARLHLVRDMRETDDEMVLGRDHAVLTLLRMAPQQ